MKKIILWFMAVLITLGAAYYQRKTGPTYPKRIEIKVNDTLYNVKLIRSIATDEKPEIMLNIGDTSIKARLFFKRYRSDEEYTPTDFSYKTYPVNSRLIRKLFNINEEKGFYTTVPSQPPAGKLQYYIEITDSGGSKTYFKNNPIIIRFKGSVPGYILGPHIIFMFFAMLFSTLAGLMSLIRFPSYKKYSVLTLILLIIGGMILGPVVQQYAFGELWAGIPFGWDLTDNKTLIALIFWIIAVIMNRKNKSPIYTAIAALILILIYSIPHSLFGSELNYESGEIVQGVIMLL